MSSHQPVLAFDMEECVDAIVDDALVFLSLLGLDCVEGHDTALFETDDDLGVLTGLVE